MAGDLALREGAFTTRSGREVVLRVYVEPRNLPKTEFALHSLQLAMRCALVRCGVEVWGACTLFVTAARAVGAGGAGGCELHFGRSLGACRNACTSLHLRDRIVCNSAASSARLLLTAGRLPGERCQTAGRACRWDEEVYGLEYDLGIFHIVAVDDFAMGGFCG